MDIEARLAAIEKLQSKILDLLHEQSFSTSGVMSLKEAAAYVNYSPDHFRRLAVEQRVIPFSRPSGQQKGKLLFRKADLDRFLDQAAKDKRTTSLPGRKRKSTEVNLW